MRFFAHDGKTTHGPAPVEELLKLPGFDGDTLVCPLGSTNSDDWKPAMAYPLFKRALLSPDAPPAPMPMPIPLPAPAPTPAPTKPCPRCAGNNPEPARFCNACGASLEPAPASPFAIPMDMPSKVEPLPPMASAVPEPARKPQSGKMGQLAALEDISAAVAPIPSFAPVELSTPEVFVPDAAAIGAPVPAWKRPALAACLFAGVAAASAVAWRYLARPQAPPPEAASELEAPAPPSVAAVAPEPPAPAPVPMVAAPVPAPGPRAKPQAAQTLPPAKPKRKRRRRPKAAPEEPKPAPSAAATEDPALEALLSEAAGPAPAAAAAESKLFIMPGLQRPISASERAAIRNAETNAPRPKTAEPPPSPAPVEPAAPAPEQTAEPKPAPEAATEGDQLALMQVHEQFNFCAQLLAQGAFGDHYDTCLCDDAREAAPYRGRRSLYISILKKDASAARLRTAASILSSKLDGGTATVSARWSGGSGDRGVDVAQRWRLEDGLWCRAP
ncbi:MAG: zinc ribbon domain-containing protein [Elusimicrobia bacterium]|nr:zinc ribbon domain-containing protein [Elusimicrobiota bacterium]